MVDRELKTLTDYRKEVLNEIKNHIANTMDIDDIIIADDHT